MTTHPPPPSSLMRLVLLLALLIIAFVSRTSAIGAISCGTHNADTCRDCHATDRNYCNGDCKWVDVHHGHSAACSYEYRGGFRKEVLAALNKFRANYGKNALTLSETLNDAAQEWASTLKNSCTFTYRGSGWPSRATGETLLSFCEFRPTGKGTLFEWKNKANNRKKMLLDNVSEVGVGLRQATGCTAFCGGGANDSKEESAVVVAIFR